MSKIFDNIGAKFEEGLHAILSNAGVERADFCVGYFNLRGWKQVAGDVGKLPGGEVLEKDVRDHMVPVARCCRLLIGMHRPPADLIREMYSFEHPIVDGEQVKRWRRQVTHDFRRQLTLGTPTATDEAALKLLRQQLVDGKVVVKLHLRYPLHAKLYLAHRPSDHFNPIMSIMGSSNLTLGGLMRNGELNAEFGDSDDNEKYAKWFNDRWNDRFSIDITKDLIAVLDESWASVNGPTPYEVYLKIMYHLSREARKGVSEYRLPAPFDKDLFDFQKTAVKLAVRHLEKRGGAMIGDVVGLGKTITACAVAKFYEAQLGASTLVICPPNLVEMWKEYAKRYDLKMEVRSVASRIDARRERFFKLVIVDESHNLRNSEGQRYAMIKDLLAYQGNRVLLLTATPYNKDFSDLANQLKLFVDSDEDLGIRPEQAIKAMGGEHAFSVAFGDIPLSSIRAFEKSACTDDWRDLMKLYLVRRTRTFIKRHYAKKDKHNGRMYLEMKDGTLNYFPERRPKSIKFKTKPGDMFERLYSQQMVDWMCELSLPRYGLQKYIDPEAQKTATGKEKEILENLSRAGKRMMGFCRSGFYKRMDSSGVAFMMSLYRHAVRNAMYLHAIKSGKPLPLRVGSEIDNGVEEVEDAQGNVALSFSVNPKDYAKAGEAAYDQLVEEASRSVHWISPRFFKSSLAAKIKADNKIILDMIAHCGSWKPSEDEKLNELADLVTRTHGKEKVLVFTQFSDTARYIAAQLTARGIPQVAQVDGDSENVINEVGRFSPVSNHCPPVPTDRQTRILIATDMLSEGQNLQDGHIVINYDLPWAIIRLIQRAGRVDRIGQKADEVFCYSFFPQEGIEEVIRLRGRLNQRINENAETVGSDEVFFEGNEQNLRDLFNEKAGVLDEEDDGEVDLASQAYQIWEAATKDDPKLRDRIAEMSDVVYATKEKGDFAAGVISYVRTANDNDVLTYLNAMGGVESQSPVKIFQALACGPKTPALNPLPNHHELVAKAVAGVREVTSAAMGVLGSKSSTKYRIFKVLEKRLEENPLPLLEQSLKAAVDQLYHFPMKEAARVTLGKMLQQHVPADDIVQTVLELHKDNEFCIVPEEDDTAPTDARIICSMGLSVQ